MEIIASKAVKVLRLSFSRLVQSIEFFKKVYFEKNKFGTIPERSINTLNIKYRNNIMMSIDRYLEKKILPTDCGEAKTCFQVLFLNSIWGIRLQINITNIGNRKAAKACQPS